MEYLRPFDSGNFFQFLAVTASFAFFLKLYIIKQCLNIKSGPSDNDRNVSVLIDLFQTFFRQLLKFIYMKRLFNR